MLVHKAKRALKNVVKKLVKCKKTLDKCMYLGKYQLLLVKINKKKQKVQNK